MLTSVGFSVASLVATSVVCAAAQSFDPGDESCTGKPEGTTWWMDLVNHPECYLWNPGLALGAAATWSGDCDDGLANGMGTITWTFEGDKAQFEMGMLRAGQRNGRWIAVRADDDSGEELYYSAGPYVDGQRYGRWVIRFPDGQIEEGPYEMKGGSSTASGTFGLPMATPAKDRTSMVRSTDDGFIARMTGVAASVQFLNGEQQGECKQDDWPEGGVLSAARKMRWEVTVQRFVAVDDCCGKGGLRG